MVRQRPIAQVSVTSKAKRRRSETAAVKKWAARPLAAQRHLAARLLAILAGDFERYGAETLARFRLENPSNYVRVVAALLPKSLDDENLLDKVSDEELLDVIVQLRALAVRAGGVRGPVQKPE